MATKKKLNEFASTAISGNDISSSCLYVSALAIVYSGVYAWIALLIVAAVLFLYRKVYGEVVGALPLNGGAYNALLNTTSKSMASVAATLTILSYMATAVISASEAMHYVHSLVHSLPVIWSTIALLAFFMTLVIIGISESSKVAIVIFVFHLLSLSLLSFFCITHLFGTGLDVLISNYNSPIPNGSITMALFFGFSAAMLGISGFESSANFVEEQQDGVFPKTLKNMWIVVTVFNPLMAFLALSLVSLPSIESNQDALLSHMAYLSGGNWLSLVISIDAALVLSGAVLTSFVGVNGLIERMTLDRILPKLLLKKNSKGSSYFISIVFFLLCVSILLITRGELTALAGVYTIAFLSVMILFGMGNILLKIKRARLPRPERISWPALLIAIAALILATVGNAILNPVYLGVFFEYFVPAMLFILIMLNRVFLLKIILIGINKLLPRKGSFLNELRKSVRAKIAEINSQQFVFFTDEDDVAMLNRVLRYIETNEQTSRLKVVTVFDETEGPTDQFLIDLDVVDREYPRIDIEFVPMKGSFEPDLVQRLSKEWNIPVNFMFMGTPSIKFPYTIEEFGGVRLII